VDNRPKSDFFTASDARGTKSARGEAGFGVRSQQMPLSARAAAITRMHFDSEKAVAAATALQSASRRFKP
jgi:hypothetical protein